MFVEWFNTAFDLALRNVFYFYWVPVMVSALGYLLLSIKHYHADLAQFKLYQADPLRVRYTPTLTVGTLVGRAIVCFIPIINGLVALWKFTPILARDIIDVCGQWLDIPLVPKKVIPTDSPIKA